MALVVLKNVTVLNNPSPFLSPFKFDIEFECIQPLEEDLEWKVIYVGSAQDTKYDQILEEVMVGPVPVGMNKFTLETDGPDPEKIPKEDLKGVTVILLQCMYKGSEFVRVGYYVNNEMPSDQPIDPLQLQRQQENMIQNSAVLFRAIVEGSGSGGALVDCAEAAEDEQGSMDQEADIPPDPSRMVRFILADKPRVTRFTIRWSNDDAAYEEAMNGPGPSSANEMNPNDPGLRLDEIGMTDEEESNSGSGDEEDEEEEEDKEMEV